MYQKLTAWNNLLLAYRKASRGKRGQPNVAAFEYRLEDNLLHLQNELRAHTYRPGAYTSFYIHEPKRRLISAAPFRDRVAATKGRWGQQVRIPVGNPLQRPGHLRVWSDHRNS